MAVDSIAALIELLRSQRLLRMEQLDELERFIQVRFTDPRTLAKYLVRRNWLTVYQVNQLFQDNGENLVLGPYRILDVLGEGGVSKVFKARDTRRHAVVALKVIRPDLASTGEAFRRFQREIRMVSQLDHPNIVRASDVNHVGSTHFFAMEYVEGVDLGKLVQLSGPLAVDVACDYIRQAALGMQHAHERGLVHRDIKPQNLFLATPAPGQAGSDGKPLIKILDMGLTRLRLAPGQKAASTTITQEGVMIGSPDYLPPEQARDARSVDNRADIYSLGCSFYYLLVGQPPFPTKSLMEKLFQHQKEEPIWPDKAPAGVVDVLKKMVAKRPEDRYQSAAEVATALAPFCPTGSAPTSEPARS